MTVLSAADESGEWNRAKERYLYMDLGPFFVTQTTSAHNQRLKDELRSPYSCTGCINNPEISVT